MNNEKWQRFLSEGFIIGILLFWAYTMTSFWELTSCSYLKVPGSLIKIENTDVITVALLIGGLLFSIINVVHVVSDKDQKNKAISVGIMMVGILFLGLGLFILSLKEMVLAMLVGFIVQGLIIYLLVGKKLFGDKALNNKIKELETKCLDNNLSKNDIDYLQRKASKVRLNNVVTMILIVFFSSFAITIGFSAYKTINKNEYYVIQSKPKMIILKIYGGNIICGLLDKNKKLSGEIRVIKLENCNQTIKLEKTGKIVKQL